MNVFIAIVNHYHDETIVSNPTLASLAKNFKVFIKSNTIASKNLSSYCSKHGITLIQGNKRKGFGANNNEVFLYIQKKFKLTQYDYFLVLNPDVEIDTNSIYRLVAQARIYQADISAINLFINQSLNIYDNSIRQYPKFFYPFKSLLGLKRNDIYDKSKISQPTKIEWAAGSFLLFKVKCFEQLEGFDEEYFMYFEDVDICTRANQKNFKIYYFPEIKALHYASHQNRKIFSSHFYWYFKSAIRYFFISKVRLR